MNQIVRVLKMAIDLALSFVYIGLMGLIVVDINIVPLTLGNIKQLLINIQDYFEVMNISLGI
jgi:hypothetical protein